MAKVEWLSEPEKHDFDAAYDYLSLTMPSHQAEQAVENLWHHSQFTTRKAKDILRASKLSLLPKSNRHVAADLKKIDRGEKLSPILLMVGVRDGILIIADGYHRVCASYWADENTEIPCVLV